MYIDLSFNAYVQEYIPSSIEYNITYLGHIVSMLHITVWIPVVKHNGNRYAGNPK